MKQHCSEHKIRPNNTTLVTNGHSTKSTTSLSEQLHLIKQYCLQTACCVSYVHTNAYLVTRKRVQFMCAGYRNYKL